MHLHRHAWQEVGSIIDRNGGLPDSYYWQYMRDVYAVTQSVAVRRQADQDGQVITLGRLILEISQQPENISRAFYLAMWDEPRYPDRLIGERAYREMAGSGDYLDPAIPLADLAALVEASASVKKYVDRHLAHSDRRPVPTTSLPKLDDVHTAIDTIGDLHRRYHALLTCIGITQLVPVIPHDWLAVFRQPWMSTAN